MQWYALVWVAACNVNGVISGGYSNSDHLSIGQQINVVDVIVWISFYSITLPTLCSPY
jgi:hypothetical protein